MTKEIDNMEGLAVREQPSGEVLITMISDDNFNHLMQRTIHAAVRPARSGPARGRRPAGQDGAVDSGCGSANLSVRRWRGASPSDTSTSPHGHPG